MNILPFGAALFAGALCSSVAQADGLLQIVSCRIVDDRGPVKAMGANYLSGFWEFAKSGKRRTIAISRRVGGGENTFHSHGIWSLRGYSPLFPPSTAIVDFVRNRDRYFERLNTFLTDLKARHIAAVVDVFWTIDPYASYFHESPRATGRPESKTFAFLVDTVAEFGRRFGSDPEIWMIEFVNEGDLFVDFETARHTRPEFVTQMRELADALHSAGDHHLIDSGNALPRPASQHLDRGQGWKLDSKDEFLDALDAETSVGVASVTFIRKSSVNVLGTVATLLPYFRCLSLIVARSACRFSSENSGHKTSMWRQATFGKSRRAEFSSRQFGDSGR